jgi:transcriptional regulator with XRE-family HTH domain
VLGRLIELSGMSRVEIGERLGGGPHLVRRILTGETELKARHVVEIAELIGVRPIEFFHIVFADERHEPSPLIKKLGAMAEKLDAIRAGALAAGAGRSDLGGRGQGRGLAEEAAGARRAGRDAQRGARLVGPARRNAAGAGRNRSRWASYVGVRRRRGLRGAAT